MSKNGRGRIVWTARSGLTAHVPTFVLLAGFALSYALFLGPGDERVTLKPDLLVNSLLTILPLFAAGAAVIGLIWLALTPARERSLGGAARWLAGIAWAEILLFRIPLAFGITTLISFFHLSFKVNIPNFAAYSWDPFFARLDRVLFLGHDPWMLSHALMPNVLATMIFDTLYMIWFLVMQLSILGAAVLPLRHPVRLTFLTAYALNWIVAGVILSILFASGGPVYMERLTGDATFRPLMDLLYRQNEVTEIVALGAQEWLWDGYTRPDVAPVGISAFPSLHLSIAATCACLGFATSRVTGLILALFTAGILVGSVHLGWHYAVDGFAGILLAILFWRISARVTQRWLARTGHRAPACETPAAAA